MRFETHSSSRSHAHFKAALNLERVRVSHASPKLLPASDGQQYQIKNLKGDKMLPLFVLNRVRSAIKAALGLLSRHLGVIPNFEQLLRRAEGTEAFQQRNRLFPYHVCREPADPAWLTALPRRSTGPAGHGDVGFALLAKSAMQGKETTHVCECLRPQQVTAFSANLDLGTVRIQDDLTFAFGVGQTIGPCSVQCLFWPAGQWAGLNGSETSPGRCFLAAARDSHASAVSTVAAGGTHRCWVRAV